jgi:two-component system, chemotaxis family, protein-glutamate methylesterase/glutaminase
VNNQKIIRVLIADDSVLMRILIRDILNTDSRINVLAEVKNGREAVDECKKRKPDVVVMDMHMGEYDGVYGVREIMKSCPTPILVLSALGNTDMKPIMDVLALGAVDFLNKPAKSSSDLDEVAELLRQKVKEAALIQLSKINTQSLQKTNINEHTFSVQLGYDIIVIGSSTGGPSAIENIISNLPGNLSVPVIIAQHMPENFISAFAARLNNLTPLQVKVAEKEMSIESGNIYIARGPLNLIVKKENYTFLFDYTLQKYKEFNGPSINALMLSVANVYGRRSIGVVLTGMGRDGTEGIHAIFEAGGYTLAQDEQTSVVYGMPRSAVESGAIKQIVPLHQIGGFIVSCLS